jgi:voltage-gated potassium channel
MKAYLLKIFRTLYEERVFSLVLAVTMLVLVSAVSFTLAEEGEGGWLERFFLSMYWAVVTITTTGYGDVFPKTVAGRLAAVGLMLGGLVSISLVTATVASIFVGRKFRQERGLEPVRCTHHLLVLGWQEEGESLLNQLLRRLPADMPVVLVNALPPEELENLKGRFRHRALFYVWGDFSREDILEKASVREAARAIILGWRQEGESAAQADQRTLLTALTVKSLNPKIRILAELHRSENRPYLERAGVDEVMVRGQYDSSLMASAVGAPGLFRLLTGLLTGEGPDFWMVELPPRFHGRPVRELADYLREEHQALLIGLYSEVRALKLEDLLSGEPSAIDDFIRRKFTETGMTHLFGRAKVDVQINPPGQHLLSPHQKAVVIAARQPVLG